MGDFGSFMNKFIASSQRCIRPPVPVCIAKENKRNPRDIIEKSFQSLSDQEKENIEQDLYGSEEPIDESTEFVDEKLEELQRELENLNANLKKAYTEALKQENEQQQAAVEAASDTSNTQATTDEIKEESKERDEIKEESSKQNKNHSNCKRYVSSREFLLMFLRAERFNARLAARRLAQYFKEKLHLFGNERLSRRIKQTDLDDEDLSSLRSGHLVIPGITDGCGRLILIGSGYRRNDGEKIINMRRAVFYLFQSWLEDHKESQKKGVVFIIWHTSATRRNKSVSLADLNSRKPLAAMIHRAMPLRIAAIHLCYNSSMEHMVINFFMLPLPTHLRNRHVCHYYPPAECVLDMIPYGIDVDALPVTEDGDFKDDNIIQFVKEMHKKETNQSAAFGVMPE